MKKIILAVAVVSVTLLTLSFNKVDEKKVVLQVTHQVKSYADWKKGFDAGKKDRDNAGIKTIGVYTSVENLNLVTVIGEAPSIEVAKGFLGNPELKASMEKIGVISAPEIKILTQMD
ncbi:MAG: hypothetical protein V4622_08705 [Bacteroidota bacterium]